MGQAVENGKPGSSMLGNSFFGSSFSGFGFSGVSFSGFGFSGWVVSFHFSLFTLNPYLFEVRP
jgi:hypothetical protein